MRSRGDARHDQWWLNAQLACCRAALGVVRSGHHVGPKGASASDRDPSGGPGPSPLERAPERVRARRARTLPHHEALSASRMQPQSGGKFRPRLRTTDSPTAPRGAAGSGHDGALTLSGAPFQGTWARSAAEDASPDYNSDSEAARFSSWAVPGSLAVTRGILVSFFSSAY
ncbi:UNVERIFIED_CONTAM: hypothetical protein Sindi_2980400 [Sesamum indicum]